MSCIVCVAMRWPVLLYTVKSLHLRLIYRNIEQIIKCCQLKIRSQYDINSTQYNEMQCNSIQYNSKQYKSIQYISLQSTNCVKRLLFLNVGPSTSTTINGLQPEILLESSSSGLLYQAKLIRYSIIVLDILLPWLAFTTHPYEQGRCCY